MCGRFTLKNKDAFKKKYGVDLLPNYNTTPTSDVHILTDKISLMKWSYSPKWAKKPMNLFNAFNSPTVNAELEPIPLRPGKSPS